MLTENTYVDMCAQALEVQDKWSPLPGDVLFCRVDHTITLLLPGKPANPVACHWLDGRHLRGGECCATKIEHVWLPRIDQLIDLLALKPKAYHNYVRSLSQFVRNLQFTDMREFFLRHYMLLRGKKVWRNGRWVHSRKHGYGHK